MDTVNPNAISPNLGRDIPCHSLYRQLTGSVMRPAWQNASRLNGADINNAALAAFCDQPLAEALSEHPFSFQIDIGYSVPLLIRELGERNDRFNAGIIY